MRVLFYLLLSLLSLAIAEQDYYKLLGLSKNATPKELKKAYQKLSMEYHPDKNPDDEDANAKFVQISTAYQTLSDPEKRKIYDQYGHEGVKQFEQTGGAPQDPFDMFRQFFGGASPFGNGRSSNQARRGPDAESTLEVSLDFFMHGGEISIGLEKQKVCDVCHGDGWDSKKYTREQAMHKCKHCDGHGVIVRRQQIGPGFYQNIQMMCQHCEGKGHVIKKACPKCKGQKVVRGPSDYKLHIPKGAPIGHRIVLDGEADESPDWEAGDLIFKLQLDRKKSNGWRRRASDVFRDEYISLEDALLGGWERTILHVDGSELTLKREVGETVSPEEIETLEGQGLPSWDFENDSPMYESNGNVYITWHVIFPKSTKSEKFQNGIKQAFGTKERLKDEL